MSCNHSTQIALVHDGVVPAVLECWCPLCGALKTGDDDWVSPNAGLVGLIEDARSLLTEAVGRGLTLDSWHDDRQTFLDRTKDFV